MESTFNPDESLRVITSMIDKARHDMSDKSQYFLIWGWGAFLACVTQFILKVVFLYPYHYQVWWVIVPCLVLTLITSWRQRRRARVKTFVGDTMSELWMALGITFFVIAMIFGKIGWEYCYPFYIMLYGVGTFISGRILKFKPLVIGGIICWILASVSVYMKYDYQILLTAAALLVSYIIPGHILRQQYKNQQ